MYKRITPKLFNTTTRSLKVEVKVGKPKASSKLEKRKPKKEERKSLRAKCPYLRLDKMCARMIKEGLDGSVSDVDIKHFCNGSPLLCYYFRLSPSEKK